MIFFVSYARSATKFERDREELQKFVADLSARVANKVPTAHEGVCFFDASSIEAGENWSSELAEGLGRCKVGVALYTPAYFTREWCGKEFQVFMDRSRRATGASGIVPVLWMKATLPPVVEAFQYTDATFPVKYAEVGMQQLLRLRVYADEYELAMEALADRIVTAAKAQSLAPAESLDFDAVCSAWHQASAGNARSHTEGGISKTCFVYVSQQRWHWEPYHGTRKIGAMAQSISGDLNLQYEEIPCDAQLTEKLRQANKSNVPTVLFGDPDSLFDNAYAQPMQQYDAQYLLNCATLVPWSPNLKGALDTDRRWLHLSTHVLPQKIQSPPPHHEWQTIFSAEELDARTRTTIEEIRGRLMKQLMRGTPEGPAAAPRKAVDAAASTEAAAQGISTEKLSQLAGPTR